MSTKGPAVDKPMPPLPVDDSPPLSATIWSSVLPQLDNIIPLDGFSVPFFGDPGKGTEQLASAEPADDKAENSQANMFLAPAGASNNHNNPYYNDRLSRPTIASLDLSVKTRNSAVSGVSGANSDIGG